MNNKFMQWIKSKKWDLLFYIFLAITTYVSVHIFDFYNTPFLQLLKLLWFGTFITYVAVNRVSFKLFLALYLFLQVPMLFYLPAKIMYGRFIIVYLAIRSVLNSNPTEGAEVIGLVPANAYFFMGLFAVFSGLTIYFAYKCKQKISHSFSSKVITGALVLISIVLCFKNPYKIYFKKDSQISQAFKERWAQLYSNRFSNNAAIVLGYYYYVAYEENNDIRERMDKPTSWDITTVDSAYKNYILVLGESASADYMSLYGYPVENCIFIKNYGKAKIAMNYYAPAVSTINSLSRLLTRQDSITKEQVYSDNLTELTRKAGIKTYWISAQRKTETGVHSCVGLIAEHSDSCAFVFKDPFWTSSTKDSAVLPVFKKSFEHKTDKTRLFVIHLMGSHYNFADRLSKPLHINHYNQNVSEYLQTIEETDELLHNIYNICVDSGESFSMIYLSDHGQSVMPDETLKHGNTMSAFHIPFFQVSSDDVEQIRFEPRKHGLNFMHGLANWMGIKEKHLDPNYTFFTPSKIDSTALFYDLNEKYIPFSSIEKGVVLGN